MHTPGPPIDRELLKDKWTTDALYFRLAARRYLRIPVTAVSLLVCVLLIGLWVRSYSHPEFVGGRIANSPSIQFSSEHGSLGFAMFRNSTEWWSEWSIKPGIFAKPNWKFEVDDRQIIAVRAPHWFLLLATGIVAAIPWLKWHFSLRTLLIVMTLFALFFGAVAMSMRG